MLSYLRQLPFQLFHFGLKILFSIKFMCKKSIISLFLLVVFSFQAHAQYKCNTYSEPSIGLTFCAPEKWLIEKKEGEPYADVFGETRNGLRPNINVRTASFVSSLSQATDFGVKAVLKTVGREGASKIEVKSRTEFAADVPGFKVVYGIEVDGVNLRSIQYYFKGLGDTKIVITATLPSSEGDDFEGIVDAALKTFKITDKAAVRIGKQ